MIPLPDPPLSDDLIGLRPWRPPDAGALVAAWADPEIARWTTLPPRTDRAYAQRWIAGGSQRRERSLAIDLVIVPLADPSDVWGEVGLWDLGRVPNSSRPARQAEVGWWVDADQRGRGVATRALLLFSAWALDALGLHRLVAHTKAGNPASTRVAEHAGFQLIEADDGGQLFQLTR
ncbi:MAG: GNAT family N-acetyltransferase [Actinomycetia bacterium]|nr:GNAT family N-acetyltransferase [Actinomycetes bacterium]MCP4086791.1 GNAT family N-acetyltransferase [Actinomycetes bacterium]